MKIFIVGSDKVYAIENFYAKYLREIGVEIFHFSAQSIFYDYYQKNILNKLIFKAGLSTIFKNINKIFKQEVENFNPDVIWIFKGMEIFPRTLQWARSRNTWLVNYNGDNPFIFSGKGSGNSNVTRSIKLFHLHLTYNSSVKKQMEAEYNIPTGILPFGFDISDGLYEKCRQQPEVIKACFLGNPDKFRGAFLDELAQLGIQLDVYGNDWQKFVTHPNIRIFAPVYGDDFWLTLCRYRVQLNLMRPHNPDTHNMRTFELPGVGGIQLAPDTDDHKNYFEPGKEIFIFDTVAACAVQIREILSFSKEQAQMIRDAARTRSLQSGYRYKDRAYQALQQIKTIIE